MHLTKYFVYALFISMISCTQGPEAPDSFLGYWSGKIQHNDQETDFILEFKTNDKSDTICLVHIPAINAKMNFGTIKLKNDTIKYVYVPGVNFYYDPMDFSINGMVPSAILPKHKVNFSLIKNDKLDINSANAGDKVKSNPPDWSYKTKGQIWSSPIINGNILYFGSNDGILTAINLDSHEPDWKFDAGAEIRSSVGMDDEAVFLFADNGVLFKLNKASGQLIWEFQADTAQRNEAQSYNHYAAQPIIVGEKVIVGDLSGKLYSVNRENGEEKWNFETSGPIIGTPAYKDDVIIFGSSDNFIYAVSSESGELLWKKDTGARVVSKPTIYEDMAIIGSRSYDIYALDTQTGEEKWIYYNWFSWIESSAIIENDTLYIGSSDSARLFALNPKNGKILWESNLGGWALPIPIKSGENIYLGTMGIEGYIAPHRGGMHAVNAKTGNRVWTYQSTAEKEGTYGFSTNAISYGDHIYVGSLDSTLYRFKKNI